MANAEREQYDKDMAEALLSLNKAKIQAFFEKYGQDTSNDEDEVFWLSVHKLRVGHHLIPAKESQASAKWLLEHNSIPGIATPRDKLPTLLSCPFCGGEVDVYRFQLTKSTGIYCSHCGALVSFVIGAPDFVTTARWNVKRVSPVCDKKHTGSAAACPLCGDAVKIEPQQVNGPPTMFRCPSCGVSVSFRGSESDKKALAAWNRREVQQVM